LGEAAKPSLEERVNTFKQLIKQGYSVRKALNEAGISRDAYHKLYGEIWSDPELAPFKPKPAVVGKSKGDKPPEPKPEAKPETPPKPESKPLSLEELLGEQQTEFEKEYLELEKKRQAMVAAAYRILSQGTSVKAPGAAQPTQPAQPAQPPKDAVEDFLESVKAYEEKRSKVRETLEKMGFKLEDKYLTREEVEKLLAEERGKAVDDALEKTRVDAFKDIMREAIDKVVGMFSPVTEVYARWLALQLQAKGQSSTQSSTRQEQSASQQS
jgi:hypothetical protein